VIHLGASSNACHPVRSHRARCIVASDDIYMSKDLQTGPFGYRAYRDRTGDLRLAKPCRGAGRAATDVYDREQPCGCRVPTAAGIRMVLRGLFRAFVARKWHAVSDPIKTRLDLRREELGRRIAMIEAADELDEPGAVTKARPAAASRSYAAPRPGGPTYASIFPSAKTAIATAR
jgi:hypothetical protein